MPALAFCPLPGKPEQVRVQQVVDGDTVRLVDGRSVRLIGINTPEIGHGGVAASPMPKLPSGACRRWSRPVTGV